MNFIDILKQIRAEAFSQRDKGDKFERLMQRWLLTDPRYNDDLETVWLWSDFPSKHNFGSGQDVGIDLVARTKSGEYWAIQCKCYAENTTIDRPAVDSFLVTSGRSFRDVNTFQTTRFSQRVWISTNSNWTANAKDALENQDPPCFRIGTQDLLNSPVDWDKLYNGKLGNEARLAGKNPLAHQLNAMSAADKYYKEHDRGKLIMACGTGKTYTSLKIAEQMLHENGDKGLVLFMVPSIALLGQTLNAWYSDAAKPIKSVCICSDARASRRNIRENDEVDESVLDLARPASTDAVNIARQLNDYRNHDGLVVVFSTYQSIDAVAAAQEKVLEISKGKYGEFDLIVCDEAHRTTGVRRGNEDTSNFLKIHDNTKVRGKKRLYMTATPRIFHENVRVRAAETDCILCSMDDENLYGEEFFRVNFSYAVQNGLLTDYKVLVLTVNETDLPPDLMKKVSDGSVSELNYDDTSKLVGVISGLSKQIRGDNGKTWEADPRMMHRAVAFCSTIGAIDRPGTSKNVAEVLPQVSVMYDDSLEEQQREKMVKVSSKHIDGSMNAQQRNELMMWLSEPTDDPRECRVLCNVRCLSEGVDVPSLDAVLFLSARNSQVDVVQSVGRVMRTFHKGQPDEKKYGYIIIPVVIPEGVAPEDALENNEAYKVVWSILNALRSHDDRFQAKIEKIALNKNKNVTGVVAGRPIGGAGRDSDMSDEEAKSLSRAELARQLEIRFGEVQNAIYAKLVEKCGDRMYWENWAREVGIIAQKFIERINRLINNSDKYQEEFDKYLKGLKRDINPSVDQGQAVEMLAQHMITQPIFDALFKDYDFVNNNAVSRSMQSMLDLLKEEAFDKDTEILEKFYASVRMNISDIDNLEGKQTIIKNVYEKFFKGAFPQTVSKLGIVYTPIECVDFIIHSVDDLLKQEFETSLTEENVHILDPFVGTGTFVTRLLQSGLIKPEDMERKYRREIHCNEIVLLAYYIADVNIESVFHELTHRKQYLNYDGICLTDTFQLAEPEHNRLFSEYFEENATIRDHLKDIPIRVIIANPPYSIGQRSANDNAENQAYPVLDNRIMETYAANSNSNLRRALYDTYVKAFRWASDRIPKEEGGIVAFISNGGWLDGNAQDGFRKCLEEEFTSIYVLNLRGNARTSGELRRKEGDGIFGEGARTPIAITFLVKNPTKANQKATIYYHDIGDYLSRETKLRMVKEFGSVSSSNLEWAILSPNEYGDWLRVRNEGFGELLPLAPMRKGDMGTQSFFTMYSLGISTNRDAWVYNFGKKALDENIERFITFYNSQLSLYEKEKNINPNIDIDDFVSTDNTKISWSSGLMARFIRGERLDFKEDASSIGYYRPFCKQNIYFVPNYELIERPGRNKELFPSSRLSNLAICVMGVGANKTFSTIITNNIPSLDLIEKCQCFPMYWYQQRDNTQRSLWDGIDQDMYSRKDGISDWILAQFRERYHTKKITKEMVFFYVYGVLHSQQYREAYADDLKMSLPRIPIVESVDDFLKFYKAGKQLADLHLKYEQVAAHPDVHVEYSTPRQDDDFDYFSVTQMRFLARERKDTIIVNDNIIVSNIPEKAYEYIVNGKSAIEWLMERYVNKTDNASQIRNNANDWAREQNQPSYILDLLLSIINVSTQTVDIVNSLPQLSLI